MTVAITLLLGSAASHAETPVKRLCSIAMQPEYCEYGVKGPWTEACDAMAAGQSERVLSLALDARHLQTALDFILPTICQRARDGDLDSAMELARRVIVVDRDGEDFLAIGPNLGLKLAAVSSMQRALGLSEQAEDTLLLIEKAAKSKTSPYNRWTVASGAAMLMATEKFRPPVRRIMPLAIDALTESHVAKDSIKNVDLLGQYLYLRTKMMIAAHQLKLLPPDQFRDEYEDIISEIDRLATLQLSDQDRRKLSSFRNQVMQGLTKSN